MSTQIHTLIAPLPWDKLRTMALTHLRGCPVQGRPVGAGWSALFIPLDSSPRTFEALSEHTSLIELSSFYAATLTLWHQSRVLTSWTEDSELDVPGSDLYGTPMTRPDERPDPWWQAHFGVMPDPHSLKTMLESLEIPFEQVFIDVRDAPHHALV